MSRAKVLASGIDSFNHVAPNSRAINPSVHDTGVVASPPHTQRDTLADLIMVHDDNRFTATAAVPRGSTVPLSGVDMYTLVDFSPSQTFAAGVDWHSAFTDNSGRITAVDIGMRHHNQTFTSASAAPPLIAS